MNESVAGITLDDVFLAACAAVNYSNGRRAEFVIFLAACAAVNRALAYTRCFSSFLAACAAVNAKTKIKY